MLIEYTAYDRSGKRISGTMEAGSERVAEDILWESDLIVTRVRKARRLPPLYTILPTLFGVKQRDTIALIRQLAILLDSGLPLLLSLHAIGHEKVHPMIREAINGLTEFISEGGQFSDGIERYPAIFPTIFVRLSRIGEQTGELSEVLRRGSDYLEAQAAVKSKLRASLTYPAIVAVTAGVSVFILLEFSIPMLSGLLEEFGADLPIITPIIMALSDFVRSAGLWLPIAIVLAVVLTVLYRRKPGGKFVTDQILLRSPLFGLMIQRSSVARITQTIASLLTSGIPLLEAIQLTRDNTDNAVLQRSLERTRLELLAGTNFSDALGQEPVFPSMLVEVVRVGETAGNLPDQLRVISDVLQQDFDASMSRMGHVPSSGVRVRHPVDVV